MKTVTPNSMSNKENLTMGIGQQNLNDLSGSTLSNGINNNG